MPAFRRKTSSVLREFHTELDRLEKFDAENQTKFSAASSIPKAARLSKRQLHILTEAIFFSAFRAYEGFIRDIFLLYCLEKQPKSGSKVRSFLKPRDFNHAELLIQSSMRYLDWANPNAVIERAELYLDEGFPVKLPYTTNLETLIDFKRVRNHIAHNSKESLADYNKVLQKHYATIPLIIPTPGEFLLVTEKRNPAKYKLITFFELMQKLSRDLT